MQLSSCGEGECFSVAFRFIVHVAGVVVVLSACYRPYRRPAGPGPLWDPLSVAPPRWLQSSRGRRQKRRGRIFDSLDDPDARPSVRTKDATQMSSSRPQVRRTGGVGEGALLPMPLSARVNLHHPLNRPLPWYAVGSRTPIRKKAPKHAMLRKEVALSNCSVDHATPSASGDVADGLRIRFVYTPKGWRYVPPKTSPCA